MLGERDMNILPINQNNNSSLFISMGASRMQKNAPKRFGDVIIRNIPLGPGGNVSAESMFFSKVPLCPGSNVSKESVLLKKIPLGPKSNVNEENYIEEMNNSAIRKFREIMANPITIEA